eukprot:CAMPEP_0170459830 /NCGR_PEP_ID=MMETSP0123-20130129/6387_1 /TAXON_ID=182087 /ORGANISM="Favella ehrenbergii, Strain Fehren 1" /LENGTH=238 /DNA_ID=CAMNT_0010724545 /DNA_START=343 /DNA_END=1055 /DNA_ORIENTATION=+
MAASEGLNFLPSSRALTPLLEELEATVDEADAHLTARELIGRDVLPNEERVEANEAQQHDSDDAAQQHDDSEHLVLLLKELQHDGPVGLEALTLPVDEGFVPKVALVDKVQRTKEANHEAVEADAQVHIEEDHEVLVVVQADAVVDPDAVMVELLTAHVAQGAVLGAGWLGRLARVTPALRVEHDAIVVVALDGTLKLLFVETLLDEARVGRARQIVRVVAGGHERPRDILMVAVHVW